MPWRSRGRAGAIALVCIAVPWILPVLVPLLLSFLWVRARYLTTSREVKRFDAVTRSPVYAAFSATLKVHGDGGPYTASGADLPLLPGLNCYFHAWVLPACVYLPHGFAAHLGSYQAVPPASRFGIG